MLSALRVSAVRLRFTELGRMAADKNKSAASKTAGSAGGKKKPESENSASSKKKGGEGSEGDSHTPFVPWRKVPNIVVRPGSLALCTEIHLTRM